MSKSVTGLDVEIPVFKGEVLTATDLVELYPYLAEPFPAECAEHVSKEKSKLAYDVTGIGYQWIVNRFNEVLGPAHWGFMVEELQKETGSWGKDKTNYYSYVKITILLGNYDIETDTIKTVCKPMNHVGGHTAATPHDAYAGAVSRGIKKTAALYGVGRQTYEHSLDDDLKGDGDRSKGNAPKSNTTSGTSNNNQTGTENKPGDSIFSGVVAIIDEPKFEQIRDNFTKTSVKCKIVAENKEALLVAFNELGQEISQMGSGMQVSLNGISRVDKEKFGTELKLKAGKFEVLSNDPKPTQNQSADNAKSQRGTQTNSQPVRQNQPAQGRAQQKAQQTDATRTSTDNDVPPLQTQVTQANGNVFTGQVVLVSEPDHTAQKAWVSVVILGEEIDAQLIGFGNMKDVIMKMEQGSVYNLTAVGRRSQNNEVQLSLKLDSYKKVS